MHEMQKVVWNEGMLLSPHHFQQWDRYYNNILAEHFRLVAPFGWGCAEIEIDIDGLSNGMFSLLRLNGIMPDGLLLKIPEEDPPPESRPIGDRFDATMDHLDVYLGIATERPGSANISMKDQAESRPMRYSMETMDILDSNTGERRRELSVARKNWKIFFSGEIMSDYTTLKIAELVRTTGGSLTLRETYIPPCIKIAASSYLMRFSKALLDILSAKSTALEGLRLDLSEAASIDIGKLSLFQTINGSIPFLAHACHLGSIHPETLYLRLSQLAGELASYSTMFRAKDVLPYNHANLSEPFMDLEKKIRLMMEGGSEAQYVVIPLEKSRQNVWVAQVPDDQLFETAQFFMVVSGDLPEEQVREIIPIRVRVGSTQELDLIVNAAMPGVRLYHKPRPPSSLPVKEGHQYFRLDDHGAYWDSISRSRSIAFYLPADLSGVQIELVAIKG